MNSDSNLNSFPQKIFISLFKVSWIKTKGLRAKRSPETQRLWSDFLSNGPYISTVPSWNLKKSTMTDENRII